MNKLSGKKIGILFFNEIKIVKKSLLFWMIGLFSICLMYMGLFPSVKEMVADKMDGLPEELLGLIGMTSMADMQNFNTYFASILSVLLLIICIYFSYSSGNLFYDEENSGTIDFLYANHISRQEIFISKVLFIIGKFLLFMFIIGVTSILVGCIVVPDEINVGAMINTLAVSSINGIFFSGIGVFLASFFNKSKKSPSFSIMIMMGTYLLGYLSKIGPEAVQFLKWVSPLDLLNSGLIMNSNIGIKGDISFNLFSIFLVLGLAVLSYVIGFICYSKKDL